MQTLQNWYRQAALAGTALVLVAATGQIGASVEPPAGPVETSVLQRPEPDVTLTCDMDACVVRATYVLAARDDDHSVTLRWTTTAVEGYPDNDPDTLQRTWPARAGEPDPEGHRYLASDVVWHSDLRCDDTVTVEVSGGPFAPVSVTVDKPVPANPDDASCSAYGMPGRVG